MALTAEQERIMDSVVAFVVTASFGRVELQSVISRTDMLYKPRFIARSESNAAARAEIEVVVAKAAQELAALPAIDKEASIITDEMLASRRETKHLTVDGLHGLLDAFLYMYVAWLLVEQNVIRYTLDFGADTR